MKVMNVTNLSQYAALAKVVLDRIIPELEFITHNPADTYEIIQYMVDNR